MRNLLRFNDWPIMIKLIVVMVVLEAITMTAAMGVATYSITKLRERQLSNLLGTLAEAQSHDASEMLNAQLIYLRAGVATGIVLREDTMASNEAYSGSDSDIRAQLLAVDEAWREAGESGSELVDTVMESRSSSRLKNSQDLTPVLLQFVLVDSQGALVAASSRPDQYYYGDAVWRQQAWNNGEGAVYIGQIVQDEASGVRGVELAVPIINPETGKAVGALRALYNLDVLSGEMQSVKVGSTGHVDLIAADGTAIVSNHQDAGAPISDAQRLDGQLFAPEGGANLDVTLPDGRGVMVYRPVTLDQNYFGAQGPGWIIVIHQDWQEAYAPVIQMRSILLATMAVTILATMLLSVFVARLLTRQVTEIETLFSAVAIGDFGARAKIVGRDELGRAAEGVNAMLEQLSNLLRSSEQEFETFFNTLATDMLAVIGPDGFFKRMNPGGTRITGFSSEELLTTPIPSLVHPDDVSLVVKELEKLAHGATSVNFEIRALCKDGSFKWVSWNGIPAEDGNIYAVGRDVTQQRQFEQQIASAYAEVDQIFNTAANGMRLVDREMRMTRVNATFCALAGINPEEAVGRKCYEVFASSNCHSSTCTLRRILSGEPRVESEVTKQRFDGASIECALVATPFVGPDGQVIGILEDFRDMTQQRLAEQQVYRQNEALSLALEELNRLSVDVEKSMSRVMDASMSMSDMIHLLIEQAASSADTAQKAAVNAQEGDQVIGEMVDAMLRIRDNTQETTRRIKRLGEVSQSISEMVRLIEDLADRTTVLALNAAIQAAAAGDAGRGFAVVAEEVQRLAERATNATRQIEQMVKSIQGETNEATVSIAEATREVVEGSQLAQSAGERMASLNQQVVSLSSLIQHIADTTSQQTNESLEVLASLSSDLQASVRALRSPSHETTGGNGNKPQPAHEY